MDPALVSPHLSVPTAQPRWPRSGDRPHPSRSRGAEQAAVPSACPLLHSRAPVYREEAGNCPPRGQGCQRVPSSSGPTAGGGPACCRPESPGSGSVWGRPCSITSGSGPPRPSPPVLDPVFQLPGRPCLHDRLGHVMPDCVSAPFMICPPHPRPSIPEGEQCVWWAPPAPSASMSPPSPQAR